MTDKQRKILVVDDLPDWRKTLGGLLVDEGYQVQVAPSLAEALKLLEDNHFDLAVLDMRLDETDEDNTDGLKLASKIKECWPSVEVVIITGYQTPETLREAMEPDSLGARLVADFIPKTQTEDLIRAVKRALSEHH